ncbi:acetyltransferase [Rubrivirga marina]|uniref:Acetyltransferase n=1 Tax=Rubrivirga marina TaxID=1196024 RepID=A0A271IYW3_9BACT|nr:acetyltransferase [Rubrivirga marina]PAP76392.1 acetyltransferase [Rubrivirga marina]
MQDLVIYGTGGFARETLQVALDINEDGGTWNVLGFLDDDPEQHGQSIHDLPVLGGAGWLTNRSDVQVAVGIGSTPAKRKVVRRLADAQHSAFATLIHPRAWIGRRVGVGAGTIVCAGTMVTTDIEIGDHVILNLDCTVGHDTQIEQFTTVAPSVNISGDIRIGEGCDLGTGAAIIQGVSIGAWTVLGAGAVVVRDLPANVTAVGAPARAIKERPAGWHE